MEVKQKSGGEAEKLGKSKLRLWGAGVSEFWIFSKRNLLFNTVFFGSAPLTTNFQNGTILINRSQGDLQAPTSSRHAYIHNGLTQ